MDEFRTADVDLAAFLECRGHRVLRVDPPHSPPPWLAEFVYTRTSALDCAIADWSDPSGVRTVDALTFARARIQLYRRARGVLDSLRPGYRTRGRE